MFIMAVLSHGDETFIYAADTDPQKGGIHIMSDIIQPLSTNQHLHGIPKIFFIESCKKTKGTKEYVFTVNMCT